MGHRSVHVRVPLNGAHFPVDDFNSAWGEVVQWCNDNRKASRYAAQEALYHDLRAKYPTLLSQMLIICFREAAAAVKSWNSNHPKRKWQLKAKRRSRGLTFDARLMSLRGSLLTLSTGNEYRRWRTMLDLPQWFVDKYPERSLQALVARPDGDELVLSMVFVVPDTEPRGGAVVGIDRGLRKAIVTSEGGEISSASIRAVKRRYAHNRRQLQTKGTRSAKRRLRAMKGREKRFVSDFNHCASKMLASDTTVGVYVLEDLSTMHNRRQRGQVNKTMRKWLSNWSYAQFESYLRYKCAAVGIEVVNVSPAYTSQRCNVCGTVDRRNRHKSRFDCVRCGHSADADLNAACNIRDRYNPVIDGGAGCQSITRMDNQSSSVVPVQATALVAVVN